MPQVIRKSIVLLVASFGLAGYAVLIGSYEPGAFLASIVGVDAIPRDTTVYLQRFVASAILFGVFPVAAAAVSRVSMRSLGIAAPRKFGSLSWLILLSICGIAIGAVGSLDPSLASFYPYHPRMASMVAERGALVFLVHSALYLILYYFPWEIVFRGVMVVMVTEPLIGESGRVPPIAMLVALLHAASSSIIHIGHPAPEVLGVVVFGAVSGYLAVVSRSLFPALAIHAFAGISLDFFLVVRG